MGLYNDKVERPSRCCSSCCPPSCIWERAMAFQTRTSAALGRPEGREISRSFFPAAQSLEQRPLGRPRRGAHAGAPRRALGACPLSESSSGALLLLPRDGSPLARNDTGDTTRSDVGTKNSHTGGVILVTRPSEQGLFAIEAQFLRSVRSQTGPKPAPERRARLRPTATNLESGLWK